MPVRLTSCDGWARRLMAGGALVGWQSLVKLVGFCAPVEDALSFGGAQIWDGIKRGSTVDRAAEINQTVGRRGNTNRRGCARCTSRLKSARAPVKVCSAYTN